MEAQLLIAIRGSKNRLDPAIRAQALRYPLRERLFKWLRVFKPLTMVPILGSKRFKFFLVGSINPNSKSGAVYSELIEAGVSSSELYFVDKKKVWRLVKLARLVWRLPGSIVLLFRRGHNYDIRDQSGWSVILGYWAYKKYFKRNKSLMPIVISDISPEIHMQWAAAISIGRDVVWWQDDYHHFSGFSKENYMPYPAQIAIVLNQHGVETAIKRNPVTQVYRRKITKVKAIGPIPSTPRVGIAVNATFGNSFRQINRILDLAHRIGAVHLYLRLHPNSKLTSKDFDSRKITIAPKHETLHQFVAKTDLVFVGNSAVQLRLLCMGVPVVHVSGFDKFGYDLYGYCEIGLCIGFNRVNHIDLDLVKSFYENISLLTKLNAYVNVHDIAIPNIDKMVSNLINYGSS